MAGTAYKAQRFSIASSNSNASPAASLNASLNASYTSIADAYAFDWVAVAAQQSSVADSPCDLAPRGTKAIALDGQRQCAPPACLPRVPTPVWAKPKRQRADSPMEAAGPDALGEAATEPASLLPFSAGASVAAAAAASRGAERRPPCSGGLASPPRPLGGGAAEEPTSAEGSPSSSAGRGGESERALAELREAQASRRLEVTRIGEALRRRDEELGAMQASIFAEVRQEREVSSRLRAEAAEAAAEREAAVRRLQDRHVEEAAATTRALEEQREAARRAAAEAERRHTEALAERDARIDRGAGAEQRPGLRRPRGGGGGLRVRQRGRSGGPAVRQGGRRGAVRAAHGGGAAAAAVAGRAAPSRGGDAATPQLPQGPAGPLRGRAGPAEGGRGPHRKLAGGGAPGLQGEVRRAGGQEAERPREPAAYRRLAVFLQGGAGQPGRQGARAADESWRRRQGPCG
ncbi:unnamed protein product [Prorocentrum cordatum]|uniref:Uncharacterized protein n=1 Tax=Prorocentrum cordatum TaxID=2364126 RepID=A0ABN9WM36_9DINO|nr:unnamed protein product [Polarella glacialis]